jgi:hypothetical protein
MIEYAAVLRQPCQLLKYVKPVERRIEPELLLMICFLWHCLDIQLGGARKRRSPLTSQRKGCFCQMREHGHLLRQTFHEKILLEQQDLLLLLLK